MESRIIKVRTDGDILREAFVISGFSIDGSEYIMYSIDRDDGQNDNIFMSKLTKNTDGTFVMRNIEDASEKLNVSNVVKSLVKSAVQDNDHDTYNESSINLDGKTINLFPVIINTEQNVNNQNSYVASVKKSVTEVTKKYYNKESAPVDDIFADEANFSTPEPQEIPVVENTVPEVKPGSDTTSVEETQMPSLDTPAENTVTEVPSVEIPEGLLLQPESDVNTTNTSVTPEPVVDSQAVQVAPVQEIPVVESPVQEVQPEPISEIKPVEYSSVSNETFIEAPVVPGPVSSAPQNVAPVVPDSAVVSQPVIPEQPTNIVLNVEQANAVAEPKLVLDGSNESNLNNALGEVSAAIPVSDINAVKEFGVDQPTQNTVAIPNVELSNQPKTLTKKAGFANSKFFVFIALAFFVISCVFLGYEVYHYFDVMK